MKRLKRDSFCVECGPSVLVDEDGLCAACGASAMGPWADKAVAALKVVMAAFAWAKCRNGAPSRGGGVGFFLEAGDLDRAVENYEKARKK